MNNQVQSALNSYQNTNNSALAFATPHELILKLMCGAIERISQAKGAILQKNANMKGELIGKAIGIISGLDSCLDHKQSDELSQNLSNIYEYMNLTLAQANIHNDIARLNEVSTLMLELKSAWIQVPNQLDRASA